LIQSTSKNIKIVSGGGPWPFGLILAAPLFVPHFDDMSDFVSLKARLVDF